MEPKTDLQEQSAPAHGVRGVFSELKSWLRDIVFALATAFFIVIFVIQPV